MQTLTVVFFQDRTDHSAQRRFKDGLASLKGRPGIELKILPPLYDLAPDGSAVKYLQSVPGDLIALGWLYPRAAFWTLDANRVRGRMGATSFFPAEELPAATTAKGIDRELPDRTIWCIYLREQPEVAPLLAEIDRIAGELGLPAVVETGAAVAAGNGHARIDDVVRPRWYPVVDYGRCGGCLECLNFCLFGVFGIDETGTPFVEEPEACRNGCPACSRVCSSGAIMFPMHKNASIAGDVKESAGSLHLSLTDLLPAADARIEQAISERDQALAEKAERPADAPSGRPAAKDELDSLVDELDKSDL
jgi:NAD-dependent dihydropyrimidine dehydrogenase PreA subunit